MKFKRYTKNKLLLVGLALLGLLAGVQAYPPITAALSGGQFNAANIIDYGVFFNSGSMNAGDIQNFLNVKLPSCDTNGSQASGHAGYGTRAQWGTANGYPPPYTCLKDYAQDVPSKSPDAYCNGGIATARKSAAQIISDVSQACGVSPKTLLVLLQKEQSLVTDDWPWSIQYRSATGYGCPDTAPCDAEYYGFFNQVYNAAHQFQRYTKQPQNFNFAAGRTSNIQYNPTASCGSSPITIQNSSTAALYNYTPYQPNAAALANLYGTGDSCSAYGNRNFWRLFNDWFGSTQNNTPYAWSPNSFEMYANAGRTQTLSNVATVAPGAKVYIRMKATNVGNETWDQSFLHLGTFRPMDRSSPFYDSSWFGTTRPGRMIESSVPSGGTATFEFSLTAPSAAGSYREYFNLVADGHTWLNDLGLAAVVNVVTPVSASNTYNTSLQPSGVLNPKEYLLSPDGQSVLFMQPDGNLVLYSNFKAVWSSGTGGRAPDRLIMQSDGNLVLYFKDGSNWSTSTFGHSNARLEMQADGNMVMYDSGNTGIWSTGTLSTPNHLSYVNTTLASAVMFRRQQLETADRRYRLVFQADGNLVLYSTNRVLWSSGTLGQSAAYLSMQDDGNLVLYDINNRALWNTPTWGHGASQLIIQQDGNLVIYGANNQPSWSTGTFNQF